MTPPLNALRDGFKVALAASLGTLVYQVMPLTYGFWVVISAVIVMQANVGASLKAALVRAIGTIVGAAVGVLFAMTHVVSWWTLGGASGLAVMLCGLSPALADGARLAGVTAIIVIVLGASSPLDAGLARLTQTLVGILIAVGVATFVLPSRAGERLREGIATTLRASAALYRLVFERHRSADVDAAAIDAAQASLRKALAASETLLADAAREPGEAPSSAPLVSVAARITEHITVMRGHDPHCPDLRLTEAFEPQLSDLAAATCEMFEALAAAVPPMTGWPSAAPLQAARAALRARFLELRTARAFSVYEIDAVLAAFSLVHGMLEIVEDLETLLSRAAEAPLTSA